MIERNFELVDQQAELELRELCRICGIRREVVTEWVKEGVVEPHGGDRWRFAGYQLRRIRLAGRLQRDLDLETTALPVVLDLVEEVETLREQVRVLKRMFD